MSWDTYDRLMNVYGTNEADRAVATAKETFLMEAIDNPGYHPDCKRNGVPQRFLIERTDVPYKAKFVTFPDEEIWPGDLIEVNGLIYIVNEPPRFLDRINWAAVGRLCNVDLRWQDFDGKICRSPVCIDSGVYSTTLNGTDTVQSPDKQFKLFVPLNEDTAKFYIDKRIAVGTRYDKHGNVILECYRITGMNAVEKSYGQEGHLLICELRSSLFSAEKDNVELMICDYMDVEQPEPVPTELPCEIIGRTQIRIGKSQQFTARLLDANGDELEHPTVTWTYDGAPKGVTFSALDWADRILMSVKKDENLIGEVFELSIAAGDGQYNATVEVEVIA